MFHAHTLKSAFLALGLSAMLGACGGEDPQQMGITYSMNIQKDLVALGCTVNACHNATSTTKLKIDPAAGMEMANYNALFTEQLVIKGDGANSPLIKIPSTGMTLSTPPASHVRTLMGNKLTDWTTWVNMQAPF